LATFCKKCGTKLSSKQIDRKIRLGCADEECGHIEWNNPLPLVGSIVEKDGNVLLARNKLWEKGIFSIITGFLEPEETPTEAIVREIREELGLDVKEDPSLVGVYSSFRHNQIIIVYHSLCFGKVSLGHEIESYKTVTKDEFKSWPFEHDLLIGRPTLAAIAANDWLSSFNFQKSDKATK